MAILWPYYGYTMAILWLYYGSTIAKLLLQYCYWLYLLYYISHLTARTLSRSGGAAFNLDGGAPSLLEVRSHYHLDTIS